VVKIRDGQTINRSEAALEAFAIILEDRILPTDS
jgi:hypothetical protein